MFLKQLIVVAAVFLLTLLVVFFSSRQKPAQAPAPSVLSPPAPTSSHLNDLYPAQPLARFSFGGSVPSLPKALPAYNVGAQPDKDSLVAAFANSFSLGTPKTLAGGELLWTDGTTSVDYTRALGHLFFSTVRPVGFPISPNTALGVVRFLLHQKLGVSSDINILAVSSRPQSLTEGIVYKYKRPEQLTLSAFVYTINSYPFRLQNTDSLPISIVTDEDNLVWQFSFSFPPGDFSPGSAAALFSPAEALEKLNANEGRLVRSVDSKNGSKEILDPSFSRVEIGSATLEYVLEGKALVPYFFFLGTAPGPSRSVAVTYMLRAVKQ